MTTWRLMDAEELRRTNGLDLSRTQMMLLLGAWELDGGGRESELQRQAALIEFKGVSLPSTLHNHYSRAADQLEAKGLLRQSKIGTHTRWWITEKGWQALGEDGAPPTDPEQSLF